MALHVRGERRGGIIAPVADSALKWFPMIVGLEMNFEMIAAREGAGTMLALVSLVASVQLNMPISASFVLERPITIIAGVDCVLVMVLVVVVKAAIVAELFIAVHQRGRRTC